eukprot:Pgem_evm1s2698
MVEKKEFSEIKGGNLNIYEASQHICTSSHPKYHDVNVSIVRVGPLKSFGGFDFTKSLKGFNLGGSHLKQYFQQEKIFHVVGGMNSPVDVDGNVIGLPPLYINYAKLLPYSDDVRAAMEFSDSDSSDNINYDEKNSIIETRGDSECKTEEGAYDCLLDVLDDGE